MSVYKLTLDFDIENCQLIAINTNMQIDRLAYFINKNSSLYLSYSKSPIIIKRQNKDLSFCLYTFEDNKEYLKYYLFENQIKLNDSSTQEGLFFDQTIETTHFFLEQYKKVNYFLKISGEDSTASEQELIKTLNSLMMVSSAINIPLNKIKNINDLIFD